MRKLLIDEEKSGISMQTAEAIQFQTPPEEKTCLINCDSANPDLLEKLSHLEKENHRLNVHVNTLELDNKILTDIIAVLKKSYHTALQKTQTPSYFDEFPHE